MVSFDGTIRGDSTRGYGVEGGRCRPPETQDCTLPHQHGKHKQSVDIRAVGGSIAPHVSLLYHSFDFDIL